MEKKHRLIDSQDIEEDKADSREARGSCCTCPSILLFFLLLFFITIVGSYFGFKKISKVDTTPQIDFTWLPWVKKPIKGNNLIIKDEELQSIVWGTPQILLPLSDKTAHFTTDGIVLSGKIPATKSEIEFLLTPAVEGGRIVIKDARLTKGPTSFLDEFSGTIKSTAEKSLNTAITDRTSLTIKEIQCREGEMQITFNNP